MEGSEIFWGGGAFNMFMELQIKIKNITFFKIRSIKFKKLLEKKISDIQFTAKTRIVVRI